MMRNVLGKMQASTVEYLDVFEKRRQVFTTKLPSEIGFSSGILDLLQNLFMMRNVLEETQASTAEYLDVFEERRQVLTTKLPSEIGFARGLLIKVKK